MEGKRQSRERARDPSRSRIVKRPAPLVDPTGESVPEPRRSRPRDPKGDNHHCVANAHNNNKNGGNDGDKDKNKKGDDEDGGDAEDKGGVRWCRVPPAPRFAREDTATYGYAQTLRCGDLVWVSGTVANDERGRLVKGGIRAQTRQVFDNLDLSLRSAGCRGLEDIVQLDAAIVDAPRNAPGFVSVRSERMAATGNGYTSMATGVAALLVPDALVEMRCVAVAGRK
ncbi:translation initiation inhibitor [Pandoravirus inopinatum]|uniref:Translation initiation inhibitor n=1 Tax=Pandoravirus inopinatum TaxID=1605721 RepID=A0A0B5J923_9VIRU|nr:translation initiation inhibitor [Pandoravirus inopinatum]AJF98470.1 translation initiation inhibitor [Pandoravirus inopinatum]